MFTLLAFITIATLIISGYYIVNDEVNSNAGNIVSGFFCMIMLGYVMITETENKINEIEKARNNMVNKTSFIKECAISGSSIVNFDDELMCIDGEGNIKTFDLIN